MFFVLPDREVQVVLFIHSHVVTDQLQFPFSYLGLEICFNLKSHCHKLVSSIRSTYQILVNPV